MHDAPTGLRRRPWLCGCLVDVPPQEISLYFRDSEVDLLEWRLDLAGSKTSAEGLEAALDQLTERNRHPVLVTHRPVREGGRFDGPETLRLALLERAVDAGAEWVDLEHDVSEKTVEAFRSRGARVVISHHEFAATPDTARLRTLARRLASMGPQAIKIVTHARNPEDNLRVLELIAFGRETLGVEVVAFCMGPQGTWSRAVSVLLGSPWTYVRLPGRGAAAPGQVTAREMRELLRALEGGSQP